MSDSNINNLSELYDYYYNELDKLFKEYNPCDIHKDKKGNIVCRGITDKDSAWTKTNILCCQHCSKGFDRETNRWKKGHWKNGCTIHSLGCKSYICYTVIDCKDKTVDEFRGKLFLLLKGVRRYFPELKYCCYKNKEQTIDITNANKDKRYGNAMVYDNWRIGSNNILT